jgi:hypothetical protein
MHRHQLPDWKLFLRNAWEFSQKICLALRIPTRGIQIPTPATGNQLLERRMVQ